MIPALLLATVALSTTKAPLLKDGDRVVFLGDSITVAHAWTRAVEQFVLTRDPDKAITFINAGTGGHTAADGLARLDTDVLAHRPTVVVVNFGMNDAGYPDGSDGAAFEKNMGAIFDRLKAGGVRVVVWADTTPFDPDRTDERSAKGRQRRERIGRFVAHAAAESARRGLVLVRWNERVRSAVAAWAKARRANKLVPDKVHPSPLTHALLATSLLRALGYEPAPGRLHADIEGGVVRTGTAPPVPWDGTAPLTLRFVDVAPPLLWVASDDVARDLGDADLRALRQVVLSVDGLTAARTYRVVVDGADVGVFSGSALSRGVDVLADVAVPDPPTAPPGATITAAAAPPPSFSACDDDGMRALARGHACLWGRLFQKDQLRIAMRHERTRWLPDFVGDRRAAYDALTTAWVDEADRAIRAQARALRAETHVVVVTPVGG
jgi:lysophospholipase L1-like esterase